MIDEYQDAQRRGETVGRPQLVATIYLESLSDDGLTIAAGNRAAIYWRMRLLLSGAEPVHGTFGATEVNDTKWFGDVMKMNDALRRAIESVGGQRGK